MGLSQADNVVKLSGDLTFDQVVKLKRLGEKAIAKGLALQFDFSDVGECDSSALALLVAYRRAAKRQNVNIDFIHLPESLYALGALCNAQSIIK